MILYSEEILQRVLTQLKKKEEKKPEKPVVCKGGDVESVLRSIFDFDADKSKYICMKPLELWDILRHHELDKTRDAASVENFLRKFSIKWRYKSNDTTKFVVDGRKQKMIFISPFVEGVELPRWIKADEISKRVRGRQLYRIYQSYKKPTEYKNNLIDTLKQNRKKILSYNLSLIQACIKFLNSIGFKSFQGDRFNQHILYHTFTIPELKEILGVNTEDPIEILKRNREKILRMKGLLSQRCADILNESGSRTKIGIKWSYSNFLYCYGNSQIQKLLNIYD